MGANGRARDATPQLLRNEGVGAGWAVFTLLPEESQERSETVDGSNSRFKTRQ